MKNLPPSASSWWSDSAPLPASALPPARPRQPAGADDAAAAALQTLMTATPGIQMALLVSSGGKELACASRAPRAREAVVTMSSTLLTLSDAMLDEAAVGVTSRHVVIESDAGSIVLTNVGDAEHRAALCVTVDGTAMLGQVMWAAHRCARQLRADLAAARAAARIR
jgi:predicted regulator of Ras-like GTPase activity (Roadblock/LC7/MglB family)